MKKTAHSLDLYIEDLTPEARHAVEEAYGFENESLASRKRLSRVRPIVSIPLVTAAQAYPSIITIGVPPM